MITPLDLRDEEYTDEGLKQAFEGLSEYYTEIKGFIKYTR